MSDSIYPGDKNPFEGQDIDLYRMSSTSDHNLSHTQRRRVDFNVTQKPTTSSSAPDFTPPNRSIPSIPQVLPMSDISDREMKIAVVVLDSVNVVTHHLLMHPFLVIRRQTQVSLRSKVYHLTPFTVIGFVVGIQSKQGFGVLWKGIASVFLTKAIQIGFESIITELTPFVRDMSDKRMSVETGFHHLILKGLAIVLVTPFLCSSCAETVQSAIATENPGLFDSVWEGFRRITHWNIDRK
ncbi:unnamed protein product, partial [Medioppia subpectinata]